MAAGRTTNFIDSIDPKQTLVIGTDKK